MTKEEYKLLIQSKKQDIANINKEIQSVTIQYLEEHKPFKDGQKLRCVLKKGLNSYYYNNKIYPNELICYVVSHGVLDDGRIFGRYRKCKKDGSISIFSIDPEDIYDLSELPT